MRVTLKDGAPRSVGFADIIVSKNGNTLEIGAWGVDPAPIILEYYEGKLRLRVYGEGESNLVLFKTDLSIVTDAEPAPESVEETLTKAIGCPPATNPAAPLAAEAEFDESAFDAA